MKHNFIKILAVAAMAMLLPIGVSAQEKIIEVQNLQNVTSIVREIKDTVWLVCNNSGGESRFIRIGEFNALGKELTLSYITGTDSTYVNDFEIFRDTVYFCGQTWREKESNGIWGYFPLQNFPYVSVYYMEGVADCFTKIDVFSIDTTTYDLHVEMTGWEEFNIIQLGRFFDAVRTAPNSFTMYSSDFHSFYPTVGFYDVSVTDKHVAVATPHNKGSVIYVNKPTTIATTVLSGSATKYYLDDTIKSNMVLEYCKDGALVAVYKIWRGEIGVHSFINAVPHAHLRLNNTEDWNLADAKFEKNMEVLDILTNCNNYSPRSVSCKIFHLNSSLAHHGGSLFGHQFEFEWLQSLDWLSFGRKCFIASGHDETDHHLRLYKYYFDEWGHCTIDSDEGSFPWSLMKMEQTEYHPSSLKVEMRELESFTKKPPVKVKCE